MNAKVLGVTISKLRKKASLTQSELAEKLNVSNKTVSRWENGLGFPEVTQFPSLAAILGVTVDYLMTGERKGITVAGSIVADIVKTVDCYPQVGMLARRINGKYLAPGCGHLEDRVKEIKNGDFSELIEALMQKPIEEMKELYNTREIEK